MKNLALILAALVILLVTGCSSGKYLRGNEFLYMEEVYAHAKNNFGAGNWDEALRWYDRLNEDFPDNPYMAEALFIKGYIFKAYIKNIPIAEYHFRELIEKYPESEFKNSAEFELLHINEPDFMPNFEK